MSDEELEETSKQMPPHQLELGAQFKKLRLPVAGVESSSDPRGLPSWDFRPTDEEAQRAGFKSAEDLQCHVAGVTPAGRGTFLVDLASSKQADETPEPDDYDPQRLASSVAALQDLWTLDSGAAGSAAPLERVLTLGVLGCSQFAEKELSRLWKIDRPYLMVDVEPASRSCELICRFARDRLAAELNSNGKRITRVLTQFCRCLRCWTRRTLG